MKLKYLTAGLIVSAAAFLASGALGDREAGFHYKTSYQEGWSFTSGKFEIRARFPGISGLVNAVCLLHDDPGADQ